MLPIAGAAQPALPGIAGSINFAEIRRSAPRILKAIAPYARTIARPIPFVGEVVMIADLFELFNVVRRTSRGGRFTLSPPVGGPANTARERLAVALGISAVGAFVGAQAGVAEIFSSDARRSKEVQKALPGLTQRLEEALLALEQVPGQVTKVVQQENERLLQSDISAQCELFARESEKLEEEFRRIAAPDLVPAGYKDDASKENEDGCAPAKRQEKRACEARQKDFDEYFESIYRRKVSQILDDLDKTALQLNNYTTSAGRYTVATASSLLIARRAVSKMSVNLFESSSSRSKRLRSFDRWLTASLDAASDSSLVGQIAALDRRKEEILKRAAGTQAGCATGNAPTHGAPYQAVRVTAPGYQRHHFFFIEYKQELPGDAPLTVSAAPYSTIGLSGYASREKQEWERQSSRYTSDCSRKVIGILRGTDADKTVKLLRHDPDKVEDSRIRETLEDFRFWRALMFAVDAIEGEKAVLRGIVESVKGALLND